LIQRLSQRLRQARSLARSISRFWVTASEAAC
jgi:hypothetical protein